MQGLKSAAPLLLLGVVRLLITKATGYQEHVGEYGVHWNFFFTVAAVSILTMTVWVPAGLLAPLGLSITVLHQLVLTGGGGSSWVHSDERGSGVIQQNKEGFSSLWGYWALHLLGAAAGHYLRSSCAAAATRARLQLTAAAHGKGQAQQAAGAARVLWAWVVRWLLLDAGLWAATWAAETFTEPVSRR